MSAVVDLADFPTRADRIRYVAGRFERVLAGNVLDVGCDQRTLETLRPDLDYVGIDVGGDPDLIIDLEATPRLPFADASFDVVLCCDVLEHLDSLHRTFGELVRVTRNHLLVSLPNCWTNARRPVRRGKGAIGHYGLPDSPPADRHKWFFGLSEAIRFCEAMAERHALRVVETRVVEKHRPALVRAARRLRHPVREHYLNLYAHTLCVLFERREAATA
jgi:SAM-dependent methyltransferase